MFWRKLKKQDPDDARPTRLLAWAIGLGLLFGLIQFGEFPENGLRNLRNKINQQPASGEVVVIAIDQKSQRQLGNWPWPRSTYAKLVTAIDAYHPRVQAHDILFPGPTTPANDKALADAFARVSNDHVAVQVVGGPQNGNHHASFPLDLVRAHTGLAVIDVRYDMFNQVWDLESQKRADGTMLPTIAPLLANSSWRSTKPFRANYAINPTSIPTISASDVLNGTVAAKRLAGKSVVVGLTDERLGDQYSLPGYGKMGGVYIHALGAETLRRGNPVMLGWIPFFLLAGMAMAAALKLDGRRRAVVMIATPALVLSAPVLLDRMNVSADVMPALFTVVWVMGGLLIRMIKKRGLVNLVSGLPNLTALKRAKQDRDRPLIVAKILNFADITSTMPAESERLLVDQIVKRLRVGGEKTVIYQSDDGIFAWTIPNGTAIGHHVEALHSLFRTPARVVGKAYDVSVAFGVEIGSGRSTGNRFSSALVAAEEAAGEGLKWKYHDPERLRDATWRLSLLSQLDDAIANGEVWVAFQPQVDLRTGQFRGAEALARWTHPEKGPISPTEFVSAAEQSDRIETLTLFVLEQAIVTAARMNREFGPFDMAVNLSARLLHDRSLPRKVKSLLQSHGLAPQRLTLELTETAAMANGEGDIEALGRLRDLGINISIDDYGTGLSTLDYLKKVPANEIKIDQSFVKSMRDNRSDLVMVQSTIALAHSLGRSVVAEGVEDREALDLLRSMDCEYAQGFAIGRPTSAEGLMRRMQKPRKQGAA